MKNFKNYLFQAALGISLSILSLVLISCGSGSTNHSSNSSGQVETSGGSVTGGSNTIDGQPVENYILNVEKLPEYKQILRPLLAKLKHLNPNLAVKLQNSLTLTRTWYLVPGALEKISNSEVGIPVEEQTGQFALHYEKAVWISKDERSKLLNSRNKQSALEESAKHILHEMVMSIRVDDNLKNKKQFLTTSDYNDIRAVTDYLFSQAFTVYELNDFLAIHVFSDDGRDPNSVYELLNIPKDLVIKNVDFGSSAKIYEYMQARPQRDLPEILYGKSSKVLGRCYYEFVPKTKTIKISTDYTYPGDSKPLEMELTLNGEVKTIGAGNFLYVRGSQIASNSVSKNMILKIQENRVKSVMFFLEHEGADTMHTGLYSDPNWMNQKSDINCLSGVFKGKFNLLNYLKRMLQE